MELDNIEKLIEKYFEANTTLAEEEILRTYFSNGSIAKHLEQYTPLFQDYSKVKEEKFNRHLSLKPKGSYQKWVFALAVVFTFGIYFANRYNVEQKKALYAYQETKKALGMLVENFSTITDKVLYLNEFEVTKKKIYNSD